MRSTEHNAPLVCSLLQCPVTPSLLGRNILLSTLFSKTLSQHSSLNVTDQFSQASKSTVYFQLLGKNVHDITRCVYNFLRYFKIVMYLSRYFSRNPKRCSVEPYGFAEPCLRNTALCSHLMKWVVQWVLTRSGAASSVPTGVEIFVFLIVSGLALGFSGTGVPTLDKTSYHNSLKAVVDKTSCLVINV